MVNGEKPLTVYPQKTASLMFVLDTSSSLFFWKLAADFLHALKTQHCVRLCCNIYLYTVNSATFFHTYLFNSTHTLLFHTKICLKNLTAASKKESLERTR